VHDAGGGGGQGVRDHRLAQRLWKRPSLDRVSSGHMVHYFWQFPVVRD